MFTFTSEFCHRFSENRIVQLLSLPFSLVSFSFTFLFGIWDRSMVCDTWIFGERGLVDMLVLTYFFVSILSFYFFYNFDLSSSVVPLRRCKRFPHISIYRFGAGSNRGGVRNGGRQLHKAGTSGWVVLLYLPSIPLSTCVIYFLFIHIHFCSLVSPFACI